MSKPTYLVVSSGKPTYLVVSSGKPTYLVVSSGKPTVNFELPPWTFKVQVSFNATQWTFCLKVIMLTLRQSLRQTRRAINNNSRQQFAKKLLSQVQKLRRCKNTQKIAIYLPNDGEIDTKYIINFLKNRGFSIYLPILVGKSLKFAKLGKKFKNNRFGIQEPIGTTVLGANQLNIIFMPLVAFDKNKNRLGMGGGFYDRTLHFKKRQQYYKNPKLYGLAFDCQQLDKINSQPWDIPLDGIITPSTIYQ